MIEKQWKSWKLRARKAILDVQVALRLLAKFKWKRLKKCIRTFWEFAHGKRICRRDTIKWFRIRPTGPFTTITGYYDKKRSRDIKAMHHYFKKCVPRIIHAWKEGIEICKIYQKKSKEVSLIITKIVFKDWFEIFRKHLKSRALMELRVKAHEMRKRVNDEMANQTRLVRPFRFQLKRNHRILELKLGQFDRLSHIHVDAIRNRVKSNREIATVSTGYFRRSEELQFMDLDRTADQIAKKVAAIRIHMAEAWLYHVSRVARSYDNYIVGRSFANAFRVLADPLLDGAVQYFTEKRQIHKLLKIWKKQQRTLRIVVGCSSRYHRHFGWSLWRVFVRNSSMFRTEGLLEIVRRRKEVLVLFPYSDWIDILPVRPPRPLKEVENLFKDLPMISIRKKIARERVHHINVRILLHDRKVMRDFLRAYVAYVQKRIGRREIFRLMGQRRKIRYLTAGYNAFRIFANKNRVEQKKLPAQQNVQADLSTWFRHFIPSMQNQNRRYRRHTRSG
jgi:uncharacterized phage-associated protein